MPYLDAEWTRLEDGITEVIPKGRWIPERDWEGWKRRGIDVSYRHMWDRDRVVDRSELDQVARLSDESRERHLSVLGRDLGSVQRDGLFYMNGLEELKQSPDDITAGKVVDRMQKLGFTTAGWSPSLGGPPSRESLISWKKVLDWLLGLMAKIGKALLNIADFLVGTLVGQGGISAVAVGAFPPSLGVEVSTDLFRNMPAWVAVHTFLKNVQAEIANGL